MNQLPSPKGLGDGKLLTLLMPWTQMLILLTRIMSQAVALRIHSTSLITVCCIYLPPNAVIYQQDLNNLVDQLPAPFVILGDFNGHSTLWGSVKMNPRSRQIEQADNAARSMSDHMQRPVCCRDLKTSTQNYIHRVWQETWDQQILNKLHNIHPSTSHWAALPVKT
ncbi:hypothetical protein TNCV_1966961 [Trichonephila clavipes]|nr:hypothetical protein TNCV_1966961 [Trichonephila clavipes]